jgi:hypothetical protein
MSENFESICVLLIWALDSTVLSYRSCFTVIECVYPLECSLHLSAGTFKSQNRISSTVTRHSIEKFLKKVLPLTCLSTARPNALAVRSTSEPMQMQSIDFGTKLCTTPSRSAHKIRKRTPQHVR